MTTFAANTHVGRVYDHNEDTLAWLPERGVYLVADGMGGHASGEVASRIAADSLLDTIGHMPLADSLVAAHRAVADAATSDPARTGMGSTAVAVQIRDGRARLAWVGDSRGYLWRKRRLIRLTRDHSLMNLLLDRSEVTQADVVRHPQRHVITQTLGHGEPVPSEAETPLRAGDRVLLCSDGLNDELSDAEIAQVLNETADLEQAVQRLVDQALARGGRDNISVILVKCGREDASRWLDRAGAALRRPGVPAFVGVVTALLIGALIWVSKDS